MAKKRITTVTLRLHTRPGDLEVDSRQITQFVAEINTWINRLDGLILQHPDAPHGYVNVEQVTCTEVTSK